MSDSYENKFSDNYLETSQPIDNRNLSQLMQDKNSIYPYGGLPPLYIKKQYINNTKIASVLTNRDISTEYNSAQGKFRVNINEHIFSLIDLWSDPHVTFSSPLSPFDMDVMDAVYTIINNSYYVIAAEWVAKVLSGNLSQKLTEKYLNTVKESIDKMRYIHIQIKYKEEIRDKKGTKNSNKETVYESYLLPLAKATTYYKSNGKTVTAYPVIQKPALYIYAEYTHQIIDLPATYFETQKHFSDTYDAIIIKRYVLKRIAQIKNSKNRLRSNKLSLIWFDEKHEAKGLLSQLGYSSSHTTKWRTKTKPMITRIVSGTLEYLVETGYIKGFAPYREHGTHNHAVPIMGYEIYY